ncbi:unnamed protein product [Notodromas monacha]|uniref:Uncharacterized protein n=1 Tax=Notodromas monacha TaxID=399045 RepID=A0A7R9BX38_9CRUS|nr:unnamed protein product [Notodromas monacha]CAG0922004.1 unnamed protein product [Notodromas monacha]
MRAFLLKLNHGLRDLSYMELKGRGAKDGGSRRCGANRSRMKVSCYFERFGKKSIAEGRQFRLHVHKEENGVKVGAVCSKQSRLKLIFSINQCRSGNFVLTDVVGTVEQRYCLFLLVVNNDVLRLDQKFMRILKHGDIIQGFFFKIPLPIRHVRKLSLTFTTRSGLEPHWPRSILRPIFQHHDRSKLKVLEIGSLETNEGTWTEVIAWIGKTLTHLEMLSVTCVTLGDFLLAASEHGLILGLILSVPDDLPLDTLRQLSHPLEFIAFPGTKLIRAWSVLRQISHCKNTLEDLWIEVRNLKEVRKFLRALKAFRRLKNVVLLSKNLFQDGQGLLETMQDCLGPGSRLDQATVVCHVGVDRRHEYIACDVQRRRNSKFSSAFVTRFYSEWFRFLPNKLMMGRLWKTNVLLILAILVLTKDDQYSMSSLAMTTSVDAAAADYSDSSIIVPADVLAHSGRHHHDSSARRRRFIAQPRLTADEEDDFMAVVEARLFDTASVKHVLTFYHELTLAYLRATYGPSNFLTGFRIQAPYGSLAPVVVSNESALIPFPGAIASRKYFKRELVFQQQFRND